MTKRGQITILIILGLLVLISIVTVVVLRSTEVQVIDDKVPDVARISQDVQEVRDFVQTCTEIVGKRALKLIGDQGGYLTHSFRTNPLQPTEGEAVQFAPASSLVIPYWAHMSSDNDCIGTCEFANQRPALTSTQGTINVEDQLNDYIETNLPTCLRNFRGFSEKGYDITPTGDITSTVTIGEQQVHVLIDYPLTIQVGDVTHKIEDYVATLDVNLRQVFQLATDIVNAQQETRFLEQYSRNIIDSFSEIDSTALPPVTGFVIDYGPGEIWVKKDVEEQLSSLLHAYIPLLQVHGARNYRFIEAPTDGSVIDAEIYEVINNRGALVALNDTPRNLNVKFSYLDWWPPYIDLNCRGQICQGQSASNTYGFIFGMQQYNFAYDLSYPVLVEIENPDAFKNEGYSFKFFLESNTRNNQPLPGDFNPLDTVVVEQGSQLCDVDKHFAGPLNLKVINGRTGRLADTAYPLLACGEESCAFQPIINGTGSVKVPVCLGGTIGASAPDAHPTYQPIDTFYNESQNITLTIEPIRRVDVEIQNYVLRKSATAWELDTTNIVGQEADEETIIQLERIGTDYDEPFTTFATIKGDAFSKVPDFSEDIPIIPGTYRVTISAFKYAEPPIEIPERTLTVSTGGFGGSESVDIPGMSFNKTNPLPTVGVEYEWEVTKEDLDTHNTISFRGLKFGLDKVPERDRELSDLDVIGNVDHYYQAYPTILLPEWTNE